MKISSTTNTNAVQPIKPIASISKDKPQQQPRPQQDNNKSSFDKRV